MKLWYAQVYLILNAWYFHKLDADQQCTADQCIRCGSSNPTLDLLDLECTVEEVTGSQPGVSVYKLSCYVAEDNCSPVNTSDLDLCNLTEGQIGCYCSLHVSKLNVSQGENGSLTFVSGLASYHVQTYKATACYDGLIVTELCEVEEYTTDPLLDFSSDNVFSCRCYGTNCTESITITISMQQPTQNPTSTETFSELWTVTNPSSDTSPTASVSSSANTSSTVIIPIVILLLILVV